MKNMKSISNIYSEIFSMLSIFSIFSELRLMLSLIDSVEN